MTELISMLKAKTKRDQYLKELCQPHTVSHWGTEYTITPQLVSETFGDGLQVIHLTPIDTRPDYYVLCIDSNEDISEDDFDLNALLDSISEEFDDSSHYYEHIDSETMERWYTYGDDPEKLPESATDFPMLSWSGGMWGTMKNFKLTI